MGEPKEEKGLARTMRVRQGRWILMVVKDSIDNIEKGRVSLVQYIRVKLFTVTYKFLGSLELHDSPTFPAFSTVLTLV